MLYNEKKYLVNIVSYKPVQIFIILLYTFISQAQVVFENEIKITDLGLHFDGSQVTTSATNTGDAAPYDFYFGRNISAHGDCITTYNEYVFMTWYRGGKADRHVMLTRYNTNTGTMATIEFPHRHTGYQNKWWIGESHNTIAIGVSPLNGTIHLLYDMHSYDNSRPSDGSLSDDYFRYSYSIANAAALPDVDFTLDKFVQNTSGGYKHLSLNGGVDYNNFSALTYPKFFLNNSGDLFMYMREGGNNNGAYKFSKYNASTSTWSSFTHFNVLNAKNQPGITYNWGLYGDIKYVNGKMRIGFQRRSQDNNDKYIYQNGVYYAYSDDQNGFTGWKNHQGQSFSLPLYDADFIKVMEPGDYVQGTNANSINIVQDFDWTVTENGDVHIISRVKDNQYNITKYLHTYKPAGATDFITSEDFSGAEAIYTAGDDIFIIGLTGGRVYVEKAQGGTNNFTRVYQAISGKTFDHGQVYIANGKLYYYLMENSSGNAQPLYLQVIDLGIVLEPFRVTITSPSNDETFDIGETVQISANATDENGSISKVEFRVNGVSLDEDTTSPYTVNWAPETEGTYTVQAIAYNTSNKTVSSPAITVHFQVNDPTDLTGSIYRLKNFVTEQYLDSEGADVVASVSSNGTDKEWEFVKAGDYYNIESKTDRGILRAAGNPVGDIINTAFSAPREDSDKQWTIIYENDGAYRFKTRNGNRYLYHNANGIIEHSENTDDRSKWIIEAATLNIDDKVLKSSSLKVYPNPARNKFILVLSGFNSATVTIYDILGKPVYKSSTNSNRLEIENQGRFKKGVYFIEVLDVYQRINRTKLVVK
ncbi:Ig-like domain-containing protein [Algibacter lectus]|uniref:Putative secreted protein (Por secretion system target) n=1 Tax=Algibacter lectus TaxID=221126 RepID=A0A4R8ME20_9FLAO|nr:Ig-like domain-containing protein [Algibacter lectus]MWW23188.1 T9SS type A sorting domain-containing protein [Algibacter lectus]TDY64133.1 putative secreted protein (Por secretion system target) [Algibacter lectus]